MQQVATDKAEFAALPFKAAGKNSPAFNPQVEFQSFLREADPIYSRPAEPKVFVVNCGTDKTPHASVAQPTRSNQDNNKDNQSSSNHQDNAESNQLNDQIDVPQQRPQKTADAPAKPAVNENNKPTQNKNELSTYGAEDAEIMQEGSSNISNASELVKTEQQFSVAQPKPINSKTSELTVASDLVNPEQIDEQPDSVDWLTLLEQSQNTDFETNTQTNVLASLTVDEELVVPTNNNTDKLLATEFPVEKKALPPSSDLNTSPDQVVLVTEEQINTELLLNDSRQSLLTKLTEMQSADDLSPQVLTEIEQVINRLGQATDRLQQTTSQIKPGQQQEQQELDALALAEIDPLLDEKNPNSSLLTNNLDLELLVAVQLPIEVSAAQNSQADLNVTPDKPESTSSLLEVNQLKSPHLQVELLAESNIKNMSSIVELPEQRLDAALANLADRLLPDNGKNHFETKFPDVKKAFLGVDSMALKADFVATLKAGIEEFKAQLSQGHLPSFDLTALVSDSYANVTGTQVSSPQLSATLNRFTQTLDVSSLLNAGSDSSLVINTLEKITSKENLTQSHILQNKHGQQLAQFDKAVNITRNEGIVQMAEKVRWLVNQHNLQAEIRLDPPDLGAMKVRVNMAGDAVTVNIVVQSQQAREVLEQATPKLKELLEQQGIELGQSSVQQEQSGNQTASDEQFAGSGEQSQATETEDPQYIEQPIREGRLGGIDYFV